MKTKKKISNLLIIAGLLCSTNLYAQMNDINGRPMLARQYQDVEGSPFLIDDWSKGTVKLNNGSTFKDLELKYNLENDDVYFKNSNGEPLAFADPVKEFTLSYISDNQPQSKHYVSGYQSTDNTAANMFYEVLATGTVQLLKRTNKYVITSKQYNSATVNKTFGQNTKYYLVLNGKATPVKNDKKALLEQLKDKQDQLTAYLKSNKVDFKKDADLSKFITYYNSI